MAALSQSTPIRIGAAWGITVLLIGATVTVFMWRQEDRDRMAAFEATTQRGLTDIEKKVDQLRSDFNIFKVEVRSGTEDRFRRSDMKLWLYKARTKYPDLPDVE